MDAVKTGKLIASIRGERGFTQKQLAEMLHISHTTVSKWERGAGFPDVSLIEPLAGALGVSITELFCGERTETTMDCEPLLTDVVRSSRREIRRREWRAVWLTLGALTAFVAGLLLFWPKPLPSLQGLYQSELIDGYVIQLTVDGRNNKSFCQYIDNRLVNQGFWTAGEDGSYHLQGEQADFWLILSEEDTLTLSIPGIRDGEPILLQNLSKVPCYFGTGFDDVETYRNLLQG